MIVGSFVKLPGEVKDITIDWSERLATGETISSTSSVAEAGLTIGSEAHDTISVTLALTSGTTGSKYKITNTITTSNGETLSAEIEIRVTYLVEGTNSYVSLATADQYFAVVESVTWLGLAPGAREALIMRATRLLNRQLWDGDKTDPAQTLAWPRTGLAADWVVDGVTPQQVKDACCEIALALANGSDVEDVQNQSQKIRSLQAGSASLSYFRGVDGAPLRFPLIIQELLRGLFGGGNVDAPISEGVDGESSFEQPFDYSRGF